jgi:hypothetical protein
MNPRFLPSRPPRLPGLRASLLLVPVAVLALATPGCNAPRAPQDRRLEPTALPNLRRASLALEEQVARELEHVESLQAQLDELKAGEERLYADVLEAEETYQRLQGDADGARNDVDFVEADLADVRTRLANRRSERDAARAELKALEGQLREARAKGLATRAEKDFWRGGVDENGLVSPFRQLRMEEFRQRWSIPVGVWNAFLADLGLERLRLDAVPVAPPPRPKAPDDVTVAAPEPAEPTSEDPLPVADADPANDTPPDDEGEGPAEGDGEPADAGAEPEAADPAEEDEPAPTS